MKTLLVLALLLALPPTQAQDPPEPPHIPEEAHLVQLRMEVENAVATIEPNGIVQMPFVLIDSSIDNPGGLADGQAQVRAATPHFTKFEVVPLTDDPAWSVAPPPQTQTYAGDTVELVIYVSLLPNAREETYQFVLQGITRGGAGRADVTFNATFTAISPGLTGFNALIPDAPQLKPRELTQTEVKISNFGIFKRSYTMEIVKNDCHLDVGFPSSIALNEKETKTFDITIEGPDDKLWYLSEGCPVEFEVASVDFPSKTQRVIMVTSVQGPAIFIDDVAPVIGLILLLLLLLLLAKRRKERVEEEILGKPQKPWTIPAEALYLAKLKEKDERAWYVLRHYLMEDEYRSSLDWYHAYKAATKGSRARESLIVREEHKYDRWQNKWARRIMAPEAAADAYETKLQSRLDRQARKDHRKQLKAWSKGAEKAEENHMKKVARAERKWEAAVRRARKKGLDEPPRPDIDEPDFGVEPEIRLMPLAEHKWQAKADKQRARAEKKEARIRAKFEKLDAKHRRKVRKKVQKVARKLDDPEFVSEHPLLQEPV